MSDSRLLRKEPCPSCGSRDNLARYSDGHAHCFTPGCGHYERGDGEHTTRSNKERTMSNAEFIHGETVALPKRSLTEDTCSLFGYTRGKKRDGTTVQIAPYYWDGELVAQHLRTADKQFPWIGSTTKLELFGQRLWRDAGKMVVVTEGEIDAMSVSQLQGNKWPVVSIPNGADAADKYLRMNIEWLERFETVVLMFDMDDAGRKAVERCAPLFTPGRCKVASLPLKDANEMLVAGRGKELIDAIWGAKEFRPDGVVSVTDITDQVLKPLPKGDPWFLEEMTAWTFGRRSGEIYAFGAGTGVGKTDFFTQQIAFDLFTLRKKVGVVYLEQNPRETVRRIAGKAKGRIFHVPDGYSQEELEDAVRELGRVGLYLYDHFGSTDWELIKSRIRYMVVGLGCEHIYLDHLTALVASEEDEKKALDRIMAELAGQAQELGHKLHFISHLATPEGKPHEEGGRVMVRHFRGSRAIGFWSHFMFGLERNQQAEDEAERSTTTLRCLKDRPTGQGTGKTLHLGYDRVTGLLRTADEPSPFGDHPTGGDPF